MKVRNFNEWASDVYEGKKLSAQPEISTYFYDKGEADPRSLFECMISSVDNSINEALDTIEFNFYEADRAFSAAIAESLKAGNDEAVNEMFDSVKKAIKNTIDGAKDIIGKGIQIGAELYTSVKDIAGKVKDAVSKVYENVKKFLSLAWKWAMDNGKKAFKKVKKFVGKDLSATAVTSLSTVLNSKSAEKELEEAPKDLKGAVGKISGKTYNPDPAKAIDDLKKSAEKLEDTDSDEVDEIVIDELVEIGESAIDKMLVSMKGLLLEGYTIEELVTFLDSNDESLLEEHSNKKSMLGWLIEAVGFALNPFAKLYEFAIKAGTNGVMIIVSSIARGGVKNSYKYVVMGTICSLVYHIIHGISGINQHLEHMGGAHESLVNEGFEVKLADGKRLFGSEDMKKIAATGVGAVFAAAMKHFFPILGLIFEIAITAFAAFELMIAFCELSEKHMGTAACKVIMKAEHGLESLASGRHH